MLLQRVSDANIVRHQRTRVIAVQAYQIAQQLSRNPGNAGLAEHVTGAEELIIQARYYQKIVRTMRSDHGSNRRGRERRRAKRNAVRLAKGNEARQAKREGRRPRVEVAETQSPSAAEANLDPAEVPSGED